MLTVYSKFEQEYEAICPTCELNEEKSEWQKTQQKHKHRSEVNPLITYCHDNLAEWWEVSFELKKRESSRLSKEDKDERSALIAERIEELKYVAHDYREQLPYKSDCGMTEEQWWKQVERKRREIKERDKQEKLDSELESNSPTWQILDKMEDLIYDGCKCEAELMRQGQFCPVCRLMVKVHEYTLNLFKDAAQGRT
jgi:hypothetical protein